MNMKLILSLIVLVALGIGAYVYFAEREGEDPNAAGTVSGQEEHVRAAVIAFGTELQNVLLLAPQATVSAQMDEHYSDYVAQELLSTWKANPAVALGRKVSSPYPQRIDVVTAVKQNDTRYVVEANILEVTSTGPAAVQPITLTLENRDDAWLITSVQLGTYSTVPAEVTLTGETLCLPQKDTAGPTAHVCNVGLTALDGENYALDLSAVSMMQGLDVGVRIEVTGIMVPLEQLSIEQWQKYDIKGIVRVSNIREL